MLSRALLGEKYHMCPVFVISDDIRHPSAARRSSSTLEGYDDAFGQSSNNSNPGHFLRPRADSSLSARVSCRLALKPWAIKTSVIVSLRLCISASGQATRTNGTRSYHARTKSLKVGRICLRRIVNFILWYRRAGRPCTRGRPRRLVSIQSRSSSSPPWTSLCERASRHG